MIGCAFIFLLLLSGTDEDVTENLTTDPTKAQFIFTDVELFLHAHEMLTPECDSIAILQAEYIDKGSPGLKKFIEKYGLTAEMLDEAIRKRPEKYGSLHDMPELLAAQAQAYREAYAKLKKYIPKAVYPPTYFLVEAFRGIGSGSTEGQLISVEKWNRPIEDKRTLLIHELVHFQQVKAVGYEKYKKLFGPEKNLLGLCIREGTAEFFADLVTGTITQDEAVAYTLKHEKRLWEWFLKEMHGRETGDWMWKKPTDPEQPRHVGYVMGHLIVEAYYNNAKDKAKAVSEILSVTDYPAFLEKSGYADKFKE
ncbi:MAG: DUF2268 domain-containing putative Zn-dependent protease [Planctomycetota bacterium]|jgi:hypothetical protein